MWSQRTDPALSVKMMLDGFLMVSTLSFVVEISEGLKLFRPYGLLCQ